MKINKNYIILGVVVVFALFIISKYNSFITYKNSANIAWSQVENQYQRRYDMIPQLVESVKTVFDQEGNSNVYLELAKAREAYTSANTVDDKIVATQNMNSSLSRLLAITENYPQLKANENVMKLQDQIEGTENRLAVERSRFNEAVGVYNRMIMVFPGNILAGIFGFGPLKTFESASDSQTRPEIKVK